MTAAAKFKQADVTRALKAVRRAGYHPTRFEVDPSGNIVVDVGTQPVAANPIRRNPLDRLLDQ